MYAHGHIRDQSNLELIALYIHHRFGSLSFQSVIKIMPWHRRGADHPRRPGPEPEGGDLKFVCIRLLPNAGARA
jgi:hypothetical protein